VDRTSHLPLPISSSFLREDFQPPSAASHAGKPKKPTVVVAAAVDTGQPQLRELQ
jgi:hypothetical protein